MADQWTVWRFTDDGGAETSGTWPLEQAIERGVALAEAAGCRDLAPFVRADLSRVGARYAECGHMTIVLVPRDQLA